MTETVDKPQESNRFSLNLFLTGFIRNIFSPRTWAWLAFTALTCVMCWRDGDHAWLGTLVVCECIITIFFIGGKAFQDAINHMVKARMDVDVKLGKGGE